MIYSKTFNEEKPINYEAYDTIIDLSS